MPQRGQRDVALRDGRQRGRGDWEQARWAHTTQAAHTTSCANRDRGHSVPFPQWTISEKSGGKNQVDPLKT